MSALDPAHRTESELRADDDAAERRAARDESSGPGFYYRGWHDFDDADGGGWDE